jgi:hypothetical protein
VVEGRNHLDDGAPYLRSGEVNARRELIGNPAKTIC